MLIVTIDESSSEGSDSAVSSSDSEEDVVSRSNSNNSSSDSEDSDNSHPFSTKSESERTIFELYLAAWSMWVISENLRENMEMYFKSHKICHSEMCCGKIFTQLQIYIL